MVFNENDTTLPELSSRRSSTLKTNKNRINLKETKHHRVPLTPFNENVMVDKKILIGERLLTSKDRKESNCLLSSACNNKNRSNQNSHLKTKISRNEKWSQHNILLKLDPGEKKPGSLKSQILSNKETNFLTSSDKTGKAGSSGLLHVFPSRMNECRTVENKLSVNPDRNNACNVIKEIRLRKCTSVDKEGMDRECPLLTKLVSTDVKQQEISRGLITIPSKVPDKFRTSSDPSECMTTESYTRKLAQKKNIDFHIELSKSSSFVNTRELSIPVDEHCNGSPEPSVTFSHLVNEKKKDNQSSRREQKPPTQSENLGRSVEKPVVSLGNFSESLFLDFGGESLNIVGTPRSKSFILQAPVCGLDVYKVEVENVPEKKGFKLEYGCRNEGKDAPFLLIKKGEPQIVSLCWTPINDGGVREVVHLKLQKGRVRIIAYGKASTKKKSKSMKSSSIKGCDTTRVHNERESSLSEKKSLNNDPSTIVRKSILKKKTSTCFETTGKPKQISEDSSSRLLSTQSENEKWAEKQCESFQSWMNFILQPTDDITLESELHSKYDCSKKSVARVSFRMLMLYQQRAQAQLKAVDLFNSQEFRGARSALHKEIQGNLLSMKSDQNVLANIGLRKQLISLLLSYSANWLRLALETVFQETISMANLEKSMKEQSERQKLLGMDTEETRKPTIKMALKKFIIDRILSDPEIVKKFTKGKCKVASGRFGKQCRDALHKNALLRILTLLLFLEAAKIRNIINSSPCLFQKNGLVKSSREILAILCRDYMYREGNVFKHLAKIGITVSYEQTCIDEFDFNVTNLAIDLRDGVRLQKLAERLTGDDDTSSYFEKMRLPAISRLQKLHNVRLALTSFSKLNIPNLEGIHASHIVDGHRPQVLKLLWLIISQFKLSILLPPEQLKQEIASVRRANKFRRYTTKMSTKTNQFRESISEDCFVNSSDTCMLLLKWCQVVCSSFELSIENFSSSFADGKVLCLLVHYYHPQLLKLSEILPTTNDNSEESYDQLLCNEYHNATLAQARMKEIGGIPIISSDMNTVNIPEERSMIVCVAYLCSRLLESSNEIFAAISIQSFYRKYQSTLISIKKRKAAIQIIAFWNNNKVQYFYKQRKIYIRSVKIIESFFQFSIRKQQQSLLDQKELIKKQNASFVIQKWCRNNVTKNKLKSTVNSAVMIQKTWRRYFAQIELKVDLICVTIAQSVVRKFLTRKEICNRRNAAIVIQCLFRQWMAKASLFLLWIEMDNTHRLDQAVLYCQSLIRRNLVIITQKKYLECRSAQKIQGAFRCWYSKRKFMISKEAAVNLQAFCRRWMAQKNFDIHLECATIIQKIWRGYKLKLQYNFDLSYIVFVQSLVRRNIAIKATKYRVKAAINLQAFCRRWMAQKNFNIHLGCATIIQKTWRRYTVKLQYNFDLSDIVFVQSLVRRNVAIKATKHRVNALIKIQTVVRKWLALTSVGFLREAKRYNYQLDRSVITCQSLIRRNLAINKYKRQHLRFRSAQKIQSLFRSYNYHYQYTIIRKRVVKIQAFYRRWLVKKDFKVAISSVTTIQKIWRMHVAQTQYNFNLNKIILVQSLVRKVLVERTQTREGKAVIKIQSSTRSFLSVRMLVFLKNKRDKLRHDAAIKCQSFLRQKIALNEVLRLQNIHSAARQIQNHWRLFHCQSAYKLSLKSIICIQRYARAFVSIKKYCKMQHCATIIQKNWRGYIANIDYICTIVCAIKIQCFIRQYSSMKRYKRLQNTVTIIQSYVRAFFSRQAYREKKKKAIRIQKFWRLIHYNSKLKQKLIAVRLLQKLWRGFSCRFKIESKCSAAIEIQRIWRGYNANIEFLVCVMACIKIQSMARKALACKEFLVLRKKACLRKKLICRKNLSAIIIQKAFKCYTFQNYMLECLVRLQCLWRGAMLRDKLHKKLNGVLLLQSVFRGNIVRRNSSPKIRKAFNSVTRANKGAKSKMTLGSRTAAALLMLQTSKRLTEIMNAVMILEVSTRLSKRCCNSFAKAGASEIMYNLIQSCNRSLPHMEMLHYILTTLSNVSDHSELVCYVATASSVEILLDIIQMFRDKEKMFSLASIMMERILFSSKKLTTHFKKKENIKRLKAVCALSIRKAKNFECKHHEVKNISSAMTSNQKRSGHVSAKTKNSNRMMVKGIRSLQRVLIIIGA